MTSERGSEATLEQTSTDSYPPGREWFVLNARDARWLWLAEVLAKSI